MNNRTILVPTSDPAIFQIELKSSESDGIMRSGQKSERYTFASQNELLTTMLQYMLNAHYLDRYDPNEILNYGCWCQTSPDHEKHRRGTPVDSVDRKCQNWYRCQRCVTMDTFGQCAANEVFSRRYRCLKKACFSKFTPYSSTHRPKALSAQARTQTANKWLAIAMLHLLIQSFSV